MNSRSSWRPAGFQRYTIWKYFLPWLGEFQKTAQAGTWKGRGWGETAAKPGPEVNGYHGEK